LQIRDKEVEPFLTADCKSAGTPNGQQRSFPKYFLKRRRNIWWFQEKSVTLQPEIDNRL
jgi:hypothetical protein